MKIQLHGYKQRQKRISYIKVMTTLRKQIINITDLCVNKQVIKITDLFVNKLGVFLPRSYSHVTKSVEA